MKIMEVKQCGAVTQCMASPQSYADRVSRYSKEKPVAIASYALRELENALALDRATHEANAEALKNNQAVHDRVKLLMEEIGMPARYSERDRTSRSRYPKSITRDAGYITDLAREVKISDGWDSSVTSHARLLERYKAYEVEARKQQELELKQQEAIRNAEIERRKADMELAAILLRYDLPIETDWEGVLENLTARDQRLMLAVAMQQTRMDWNDGPYLVRNAVDKFRMETDEDKAILNDVIDGLTDFEDGRVFRDCNWNYERLFDSVADKQLAADVRIALGRLNS